MLEHNLDISVQSETILLLFCEQKYHTPLLLTVKATCRIRESFVYVEAVAGVDFEEGCTSSAAQIWHIHKLDSLESLASGRLDLVPIEGLKVVEISELARLTDSFATCKSLVAIKQQTVVNVVEKAQKEKDGTNGGPCTSLARITVHNYHVLRVSFKPVVSLFCDFVEEIEGGSMVIRPVILGSSSPKVSFFVVGGSLRCVNDIVLVSVALIQKIGNLKSQNIEELEEGRECILRDLKENK